MKTNVLLVLAYAASLFSATAGDPPVPKSAPLTRATLRIEVGNLRSKDGTLFIGLSQAPGKCFPDGGYVVERKVKPIKNINQVVEFDNLNPGDYAIVVSHDINDNNKLDKSWAGIPKEPYGFSNNVKPTLSAPSFKDCRVAVASETQTIHIDLIQP